MVYLDWYQRCIGCRTPDEVFHHLMTHLKPSNREWSYFVNWTKVFAATDRYQSELSALQCLIGVGDFDSEFRALLRARPQAARLLPLLAVRDGATSPVFQILQRAADNSLGYTEYDFRKLPRTEEDIERLLEFVAGTGIKHLLQSGRISNLADYLIGVEAGLDSNGRKNRSGQAMEAIVEDFIQEACQETHSTYIKEATAAIIHRHFGVWTPADKSSRRYDFAIHGKRGLFLVEANFYGGSGSKLKATAGEYRSLQRLLRGHHTFIWITDGPGWIKTSRPLRDAFEEIDHVFSLDLLERGVLQALLQ